MFCLTLRIMYIKFLKLIKLTKRNKVFKSSLKLLIIPTNRGLNISFAKNFSTLEQKIIIIIHSRFLFTLRVFVRNRRRNKFFFIFLFDACCGIRTRLISYGEFMQIHTYIIDQTTFQLEYDLISLIAGSIICSQLRMNFFFLINSFMAITTAVM